MGVPHFFLSYVFKIMGGLHSTPRRKSINTALNTIELRPGLDSAKDIFSNFSANYPQWFPDYIHLLPDPKFIGIALITPFSCSIPCRQAPLSFTLTLDHQLSLPTLFSFLPIHLVQQPSHLIQMPKYLSQERGSRNIC